MMPTWKLLKYNPHLFQRYFIKEYLIKACRKFFEDRNYHELESPLMTDSLPQERYLDVLDTKIENSTKTLSKTAYITPTTETYNKRILAAGLGEHFVITKVARGTEDIGPNHLPEFTMLEWYHLNTDYHGLMNDCEQLFKFAYGYIREALRNEKTLNRFMIDDSKFNNNYELTYQGQTIKLGESWDRVSVPEALEKYSGIRLQDIQSVEEIKKAAIEKGYNVGDIDDWQTIFELIFASEIEPIFAKDKPTFVYEYPKQVCVLVKPNLKNPLVCEKVELYFAGKEVANGYTELIDWKLQEQNFLKEQAARKELGMKDVKMDTDLIEALKEGLPDVSGIGMGLDRVAMIFADAKSISDINYFPASDWL